MSLLRAFGIAMEGLALNKVRSFLTMLGLIIGVAAVIIMMAVSYGAEAEVADQINALGANLIMIMPSFTRGGVAQRAGPPPMLKFDDIATIQAKVTGISGVSAEQNTSQNVKAGSVTLESISIVGTTAGFMAVREYGVAEGRFITDADNDSASEAAVLGSTITQKLFSSVSPVGLTILGRRAVGVHPVGHDLSILEINHTFGAGGNIHLVRHHHDCRALLVQPSQQVHDLHAGAGVQVAGRFVGQDDGRRIDQRARNGHSLLLPARKLVRLVTRPLAQSHHF